MSGVRALGLCLECSNAIELITLDSVLTFGKCCTPEVECVRLSRHWPVCKAGEDVFSDKSVCDKLVVGSPTKMFHPFRIVALPSA